MMNSRTVELWVGLFVVGGFAALFMLAMQVSNLSTYSNEEGYEIEARFENASGLKVRSPVTMAGVTLGRVTGIHFDNKTYQAIVTMRIEQQYDKLPNETSASINTAGLLGEKYIGLQPGSSSNPCDDEKLKAELEGRKPDLTGLDCKATYLTQGSEIILTQGSLVLEELIAKFVQGFMDSDDDAPDEIKDETKK